MRRPLAVLALLGLVALACVHAAHCDARCADYPRRNFSRAGAGYRAGRFRGTLGPHADILIHQIVTAMYNHGTAESIAKSIHVHPTLSEVVKNAAKQLRQDFIPIHETAIEVVLSFPLLIDTFRQIDEQMAITMNAGHERRVDEIVTLLGIAHSTTCIHLRVLKEAHQIATDKRGRNVFYALTEPVMEMELAGQDSPTGDMPHASRHA